MKNTNVTNILNSSLVITKLAKIIADMNISVVFSQEETTASYDHASRTLVLPYSIMMDDEDIRYLMLGHELAHVINSPFSLKKYPNYLWEAINIVLDVRDEHLFLKDYHGFRKHFISGYKKLLDKNFFGDKQSLIHARFSSRLNVYAKLGHTQNSWVPMSEKEIDFYNRCLNAKSEEECINLAKELIGVINQIDTEKTMALIHTMDPNERISLLCSMTDSEKLYGSDGEFRYSDDQVIQLLYDAINSMSSYDQMTKKVASTQLKNSVFLHHTLIDKSWCDRIFSWEKFIEIKPATSYIEKARLLRKEAQVSVDHMAFIFESKKSAQRMMNIKISKTGVIDSNRIALHRVSNEVFRSRMSVPVGKNHGYVILLDCSGSVNAMLEDMIGQLVVLTEFFRKIQVPYRVVGFGLKFIHKNAGAVDHYRVDPLTNSPVQHPFCSAIGTNDLVEFMSSEQSVHQHNLSIAGMYSRSAYVLDSTPTVSAMLTMEHYANQFYTKHNIQKKKLIVITDGQPTDTRHHQYTKTYLMFDGVTQKSEFSLGYCSMITDMIGKTFKNRYDIDYFAIAVASTVSVSMIRDFCGRNSISPQESNQLRSFGYFEVKTPNDTSIVFARSTKIDTNLEELDISSDNTVTEIKRKLVMRLSKIKKSKIFLNALAEKLSV